MLKEGWDVNNLYTIVPLRAAASKILREQMVGRGLRLPYGKRTGEKEIDAVMLTAHDKFNDILEEAQKCTSIFKAGNVIKAEEIEEEFIEQTQLHWDDDKDEVLNDAFSGFSEDIHSVLFTGIRKGVFDIAKFDSKDGELAFARIIEVDNDVLNWLRPHPKEFDITYNRGRSYEPDFVVETADKIYLVEVKGKDKLKEPDVIAKKERGTQYCRVVCDWAKANNEKEWQYLFIPANEIKGNSTFLQLAETYKEL